jgi:hypothetical protein
LQAPLANVFLRNQIRQKRHADPAQGGPMHRLGAIGSKASALALLFILSQERGST